MEATAGGNARSGRNEATAFPWAAHYVPVPGPRATLVRELFEELGVFARTASGTSDTCARRRRSGCSCTVDGRRARSAGRPDGTRSGSVRTIRRAIVDAARATGQFTIPMALGVRPSPLDGTSMAEWLTRAAARLAMAAVVDRLRVPRRLRRARRRRSRRGPACITSPAANAHEIGPLTWSEGNGWITDRLLERIGRFVHTGQVVYRIAQIRTSVVGSDTGYGMDRRRGDLCRSQLPRVAHRRARASHARLRVLALADGKCVARSMAQRARDSACLGQRDLRVTVARLRGRDASVAAHVHSENRVDVLLGARPGHAPDESDVAPGAGLADAARSRARRSVARASGYPRLRDAGSTSAGWDTR